jgi:hypothetical protein
LRVAGCKTGYNILLRAHYLNAQYHSTYNHDSAPCNTAHKIEWCPDHEIQIANAQPKLIPVDTVGLFTRPPFKFKSRFYFRQRFTHSPAVAAVAHTYVDESSVSYQKNRTYRTNACPPQLQAACVGGCVVRFRQLRLKCADTRYTYSLILHRSTKHHNRHIAKSTFLPPINPKSTTFTPTSRKWLQYVFMYCQPLRVVCLLATTPQIQERFHPNNNRPHFYTHILYSDNRLNP